MRALTSEEEQRLAALTSHSVELTLIEPTKTGLGKSILDATMPVRQFLNDKSIHDYSVQEQGQEYKVIRTCSLITEEQLTQSKVSFYRPETKSGDPRIWFSGLPKISDPNDLIAIVERNGELFAFNLTQVDVVGIVQNQQSGPLWELIASINETSGEISSELLLRLQEIASRGFIKSDMQGRADTAIGRTLESLLGIEINSSKNPDYRGIELKSYRAQSKGRGTRKTLFAQVPNWKLSQFKSSREIVENFGYARDGALKLYCTVSTQNRNSQGLSFRILKDLNQLAENSDKKKIGDFAIWQMEKLHSRLLEKHNETFWVRAKSDIVNGQEYFHFEKALHTRKPLVSQFDILLDQGIITMDHLIKKMPNKSAQEKGPLFKINADSVELLFPPSKEYLLIA